MKANPPWSPHPDDDPVVREPQAKLPPRVVVAFFEVGAAEYSAVAAQDEAKAIGGTNFSVRLMTVTFEGQQGAVYVLFAETRLPYREARTIENIARNLRHAPSVESVLVFRSSGAATKAVVKRVSRNRNVAAKRLHLDSFDR